MREDGKTGREHEPGPCSSSYISFIGIESIRPYGRELSIRPSMCKQKRRDSGRNRKKDILIYLREGERENRKRKKRGRRDKKRDSRTIGSH